MATIMLISPLSLFAADAAPAAPAASGGDKDESVTVTLTVYRKNFVNSYVMPSLVTGEAKSKNVEKENDEYWINSDGKWVSFKVSSSVAPKKVQYSGPRSFKIYQSAPGSDPKKMQLKPVSGVTIPDKATEIGLLLFVRNNSAKFYPVDVSPQNLPKGKIIVMNMTSVPVALSLDGENKLLQSMSHLIFNIKNVDSAKALPLMAAVRNKESKWEVIYRGRISSPGEDRSLVMLYDPFGKKGLNINVQMLTF